MPVIAEVGDEGVVIDAATGPPVCDHPPVPTEGTLPAMVALPAGMQIFWLGPAFEVVGAGMPVTVGVVAVPVHPPALVASMVKVRVLGTGAPVGFCKPLE